MLGNLEESSNAATPLLREQSSVDFNFILKILVVGDSVCGKSQLFRRFADEAFEHSHTPTQSVEYRHRYIDTEENCCKVQLWDCVSSASRAVMMSIYKGSNAIILLFDVTNISALESISDWIRETKEFAPSTSVIYLVGTKIDLPNRKISKDECLEVASKHGLRYFEISSKTGEGVDFMFIEIVRDLEGATVSARDANEERENAAMKAKKLQHMKQDAEFTTDHDNEGGDKCCGCCSVM